ncbi:MAG TPA: aminoglycoside phosphotransferase family protein [Chitinophagaceae bacterium]|nr:aminoglycoside phosphotransferase family protein [Chitinophagaceae bacterium]
MSESVLAEYGLQGGEMKVEKIGSGLINHTWKVSVHDKAYILQRINQDVFSSPADIAYNVKLISDYLQLHHPEYNFIAPLSSLQGRSLIYREGEGYFRLFPFVNGSHSKDTVETPDQAYEAARQFGRFTRLLSGMDISRLRITIPSFHDLEYRYEEFLAVLDLGDPARIKETKELAQMLIQHADIVREYKRIKADPSFKLRVTHHDTKISNVLFDTSGKGLCIIDLDTLMPGYFISDIGDMMRTYLSPVNEEGKNTGDIFIRENFYHAIVEGYHEEMKDELRPSEKDHFFYAALFMTYMQALRFLTDYLNNDRYYVPVYAGQNLVRAKNQSVLLERLLEKKNVLS